MPYVPIEVLQGAKSNQGFPIEVIQGAKSNQCLESLWSSLGPFCVVNDGAFFRLFLSICVAIFLGELFEDFVGSVFGDCLGAFLWRNDGDYLGLVFPM